MNDGTVLSPPVALFIPVLLLIVKLGVGIPSQLKGFLLYIQVYCNWNNPSGSPANGLIWNLQQLCVVAVGCFGTYSKSYRFFVLIYKA